MEIKEDTKVFELVKYLVKEDIRVFYRVETEFLLATDGRESTNVTDYFVAKGEDSNLVWEQDDGLVINHRIENF